MRGKSKRGKSCLGNAFLTSYAALIMTFTVGFWLVMSNFAQAQTCPDPVLSFDGKDDYVGFDADWIFDADQPTTITFEAAVHPNSNTLNKSHVGFGRFGSVQPPKNGELKTYQSSCVLFQYKTQLL